MISNRSAPVAEGNENSVGRKSGTVDPVADLSKGHDTAGEMPSRISVGRTERSEFRQVSGNRRNGAALGPAYELNSAWQAGQNLTGLVV